MKTFMTVREMARKGGLARMNSMTKKERVALAKKAGIASGKVSTKKRLAREAAATHKISSPVVQ